MEYLHCVGKDFEAQREWETYIQLKLVSNPSLTRSWSSQDIYFDNFSNKGDVILSNLSSLSLPSSLGHDVKNAFLAVG